MTTEKPFNVTILWGSTPEPDDTPITYEFATEAELDAFLQGVEEANGWLDYRVISPEDDLDEIDDADDPEYRGQGEDEDEER